MEQIKIYSGGEVISRVAFGEPGAGAEGDCEAIWSLVPSGVQVFAVIDRKACGNSVFVERLAGYLQGKGAGIYMLDATEEFKTMDTVLAICSWMMECGADRNAFVLAVGGGITTDMAGFAASIYKRGIRFAYVPTTLLAQVDAAVGGKTGVNLDRYKNMLGVIRQPEFTFVTARVLESLPYRDFLSGASEMVKSFVIEDGGNYIKAVGFLKRLHEKMLSADCMTLSELCTSAPEDWTSALSELVAAAVRVKAGVVSRDQFEGWERRKLNLGHTFAHAIETLARRNGMDITHGEAVAAGMVMAARLGVRLGVSKAGLDDMLKADLESCGLPVECPFGLDEMSSIMQKDKKAEGGKVHFVIPRAIGDVEMMDWTVDEACRLLGTAL
ncbi:MAG: 3-dehydroquinate synthase [Bacteroidales bacterium]|nr:3-dehydroquinate synthase [Bacteroidales bacterium]